ncbi:biotin carboxylase, chloroplast precursor [Cyanidioschyzon merolae strain 10D]|jgi:acetyl-CoA carboxylase biotin carboxylase subunit|uniref:Biotin carboxylase n=1 Tax=Cyanidioschyzon merolae (strain NIES-3377 / 10D) TaxID=280699 RepID=M1V7A2_CYAM1|nr:biotin carboxylase, chloroplast precursor [Cyanidioschyzon merolae strain 10D]BAM82890.1 biotin carboxylase, chloroplast precursor [Cyanidioschyzon merolae strain 10D]|eukprot:XP_005538926.1 biotin carboxylase, chloroplast precursor [Cyanidioschyzon merolae strain 10D]
MEQSSAFIATLGAGRSRGSYALSRHACATAGNKNLWQRKKSLSILGLKVGRGRLCLRAQTSTGAVSNATEATAERPFKVLIANRGEIAIRAIRTCQELGIRTVQVHSTADTDSLAVRMADERICIGPPAPRESYLNIPAIISACEVTGADAVYPGFGFLSENARFADLLEQHEITFIGPSARAIALMGDKSTAKATMRQAGVPIVPGSDGLLRDVSEARRVAREIGYPVMLKATAGGGGRGIRLVRSESELENAYVTCEQEAKGAFGNGALYMEKFIESPRHVEIQVIGDSHGNVIYLGERDCSVQRRNQKLLEEAPSPAVTPEIRQQMGEAACKAAKAIGYCGAGTVEYIMSSTGEFYFMEMNTRIQVEHPVTEMITGLDIVALQIAVARGEPLPLRQEQVGLNGWAMEARINCEDALQAFRPMPGVVTNFLAPGGNGVRWDGCIYPGYNIPPYYDSMLGKLICWAPTREAVIRKLRRALGEMQIEGIPSTVPFHLALLDNPAFQEGKTVYTNFIEREGILDQLKARVQSASQPSGRDAVAAVPAAASK